MPETNWLPIGEEADAFIAAIKPEVWKEICRLLTLPKQLAKKHDAPIHGVKKSVHVACLRRMAAESVVVEAPQNPHPLDRWENLGMFSEGDSEEKRRIIEGVAKKLGMTCQ